MINKEFLEGLGITDEAAVKSITDTYNADIQTEKDSTAAVQKQLDEANTTIKSYTDKNKPYRQARRRDPCTTSRRKAGAGLS